MSEPIFDEVAQELAQSTEGPETSQSFDDEDVKAALENADTADGPGTEDLDSLPESDTTLNVEEDVK